MPDDPVSSSPTDVSAEASAKADSVTSDITPVQPIPADLPGVASAESGSQVATPSATATLTNPSPADSSQPPSPILTDVSPVVSVSAEVSTKIEASEVSQASVPANPSSQSPNDASSAPLQSPLPAEASAKVGQSFLSPSLHQKATQVRKQRREEHLAKILSFIQQKGKVNNEEVRDYLHISQTTATDYLHTLVESGKIKKAGKAKATVYSL